MHAYLGPTWRNRGHKLYTGSLNKEREKEMEEKKKILHDTKN